MNNITFKKIYIKKSKYYKWKRLCIRSRSLVRHEELNPDLSKLFRIILLHNNLSFLHFGKHFIEHKCLIFVDFGTYLGKCGIWVSVFEDTELIDMYLLAGLVIWEFGHRLTGKVMHRLTLIPSVKLREISVNVFELIPPVSILPCWENNIVKCGQRFLFDSFGIFWISHFKDIVLVMILVNPWGIFITDWSLFEESTVVESRSCFL